MLNTGTRECYQAFGLLICSEIAFPELLPSRIDPLLVDINITVDPLLQYRVPLNDDQYIANALKVTMSIKNAGVFQINEGKTIIVSPYEGVDEDIIRLYILGTCMGVVLLQRSVFPLHGSAIASNDKVYAIIGESGAGKSTLTTALLKEGFTLLSDDIVPLVIDNNMNKPIVYPSYPQQKLWQNSLDSFGMENTSLRPIFGRATKFCVSVRDNYCSEPLPLAGIFELSTTDVAGASFNPINKLESLPMLYQHTFRQFLLPRMGLVDWHFKFSASLSQMIPMYRIKRPINEYSIPQLADFILTTVSKEETRNNE